MGLPVVLEGRLKFNWSRSCTMLQFFVFLASALKFVFMNYLSRICNGRRWIVPMKRGGISSEPGLNPRPQAHATRALFFPGTEIVHEKDATAAYFVLLSCFERHSESIAIGHRANIDSAICGEFHIPPGPGVNLE